jgi:uncharacterized protein (TIGR00369 family)
VVKRFFASSHESLHPNRMSAPALSPRTRSTYWHDPLIFVEAARKNPHLSGLELLRLLLSGEYPAPPAAELVGFRLTQVDEGRAVFSMEVGEHQYNPIGTVHGGIVATLLDSAMGVAVHSALKPGETYTTLEFKINFVRALTVAVPHVTSEARLTHRGRTTAISEGTVVDSEGRVYARGSCTCLIIAQK